MSQTINRTVILRPQAVRHSEPAKVLWRAKNLREILRRPAKRCGTPQDDETAAPSPQDDEGLTLVELLITVVFLTLLLGALWFIYDGMSGIVYSQEKRTGLKAEAARGLSALAEDLREAGSLTSAGPTGLTLTRDTDGDGDNDTVQYSWSGTAGDSLERAADVTTPLVHFVSNLAFSYYDAGNNLLSSPVTASEVRLAKIDLTAGTSDETFRLRSQTRLRNLS